MSAVKTQFQEELEKENQFSMEEMEYESLQNQALDYGEEREDTRDPDEMRENSIGGQLYV